MSPLRIIVILLLVYIAYRLIVSGRRKTRPAQESGKKSRQEMTASDTLEEDPICGKLVPSRQAITMRLHGNTYYFCSEECCNTFRNRKGEQQ